MGNVHQVEIVIHVDDALSCSAITVSAHLRADSPIRHPSDQVSLFSFASDVERIEDPPRLNSL